MNYNLTIRKIFVSYFFSGKETPGGYGSTVCRVMKELDEDWIEETVKEIKEEMESELKKARGIEDDLEVVILNIQELK